MEAPYFNFVCYDWKQDIITAPPHPLIGFDTKVYLSADDPDNPLEYSPDLPEKTFRVVDADPSDRITLLDSSGKEVEYPAYVGTWLNSFDYYLYEYYRLTKVKNRQSVSFTMTGKSLDKLRSFRQKLGTQKKSLPPFIDPKEHLSGRESSHTFCVPAFAAAQKANQLYRQLQTREDAYDLKARIGYDGLSFIPTCGSDFLPFSIVDYLRHEYLTGISLSIEITAALLEIQSEKNQEHILNALEKDILPDILNWPFPFTRNTVARNYIRQIILECEPNQYDRRDNLQEYDVFSQSWLAARAHAKSHLLKPMERLYASPQNEEIINTILEKCNSLFEQVILPVNLPKYVRNQQCENCLQGKLTYPSILAVFCHPKHPHVGELLSLLEDERYEKGVDLSKEDCYETPGKHPEGKGRKTPQTPKRIRSDSHDVFKKVHSRVQSILQDANPFI